MHIHTFSRFFSFSPTQLRSKVLYFSPPYTTSITEHFHLGAGHLLSGREISNWKIGRLHNRIRASPKKLFSEWSWCELHPPVALSASKIESRRSKLYVVLVPLRGGWLEDLPLGFGVLYTELTVSLMSHTHTITFNPREEKRVDEK
jgi:hypothetical protein